RPRPPSWARRGATSAWPALPPSRGAAAEGRGRRGPAALRPWVGERWRRTPPTPPPATTWTPEPSAGSGARTARRVAAIVLGTMLLGLLVSYAGLAPVLARFRALGWAAPLVLLPYFVINILDTNGWRCTLPAAPRVPFS